MHSPKNHKIDEKAILKELQYLFENDLAYKKSGFNLTSLSEALGISTRRTSKLIRTHFQRSFTEYVNDYRLEEVLNRFREEKHITHTIFGLALEAGFLSKSTFYRVFKRRLAVSPSEFLKASIRNGHSTAKWC